MKRIGKLLHVALVAAPVAIAAQPAATPTPLDNLKASMERIIGGTSARWGVYMKSLETGEEIAIDAGRPMERPARSSSRCSSRCSRKSKRAS